MAFTAHPGAAYNVIGSFNDYFEREITAKGAPAWLPSAVVNYDWPQQPLTFPSWSVTHLGTETREVAQGRHLDPGWRGAEQIGLAEISCWESYQRAPGVAWRNLRTLRDMAARMFATGAAVPILDVYGTTGTPTGNGTILRAGPVREAPLGPDPNPDVLRVRLLVTYNYLERVTAG
jgi:hypothetical protein